MLSNNPKELLVLRILRAINKDPFPSNIPLTVFTQSLTFFVPTGVAIYALALGKVQ